MIISKSPGKVLIAGEYSILKSGNTALIAAIDHYQGCKISINNSSNKIKISLPDFKVFEEIESFEDIEPETYNKAKFVLNAIKVVYEYSKKYVPINIETFSEGKYKNIKIGLGSSAAITVSVVAGLLRFLELDFDKFIVFKLAAIAHYLSQNKIGSSFDIAAATFGGIFSYQKFDGEWLFHQLRNEELSSIVKKDWPQLIIKTTNIPRRLEILIGWTQIPADTSKLVKDILEWGDKNEIKMNDLFSNMNETVLKIIEAFKNEDEEGIINLINKLRYLLKDLAESSKVNLEIIPLIDLIKGAQKHGFAGKFSGAGGGDIGVAIGFNKDKLQEIRAEWIKAGIIPLDLNIAQQGNNIDELH